MLVLPRRIGEEIVINNDTRLTVVAIRGDRVRLGVSAPRGTVVDRKEIHERRIVQQRASKPPSPGEVAV